MENQLRSQTVAPRIAPGTFSRGFMTGMGSGALMMSIFSGVLTVGGFVLGAIGLSIAAPTLVSAVIMIGLGSISTGLFSGISAVGRAHQELRSANTASTPAPRIPERAQEPGLAAPAMAQAVERQTNWTARARPAGSSKDRVASILADRDMAPKDRASAIRQQQEAAQSANIKR